MQYGMRCKQQRDKISTMYDICFYIFGGGLQRVFCPSEYQHSYKSAFISNLFTNIPDDGESRNCCIILKFETVLTV